MQHCKTGTKLLHVESVQLFCLLVVVELEAGLAAALQPLQGNVVASTDFGLQLLVRCTDLADGVAGGDTVLLEALVDVLLLLLELADVLNGPL